MLGSLPPLRSCAEVPGFQMLNGRWLRPDGGYILEIRSVDSGGKIDAVYLNPKPINIAKAEATRDGSTLKIFVKLRAPNYPGSTYTMTYDQEHDQLPGGFIFRRYSSRASTFSTSLWQTIPRCLGPS